MKRIRGRLERRGRQLLSDASGVSPVLGRSFTSEEEQPGKDQVVVISGSPFMWRREFGGNPQMIGTSLVLNGESRVVVGIMPAGFNFPRSTEMPAPTTICPREVELWLPVAPAMRRSGRTT